MDPKGKRIIMRIEVAENVPREIEIAKEKFGATHLSMYSRTVLWFCKQDEDVQAAILKLLPKVAEIDVTRQVLKTMLWEQRRK